MKKKNLKRYWAFSSIAIFSFSPGNVKLGKSKLGPRNVDVLVMVLVGSAESHTVKNQMSQRYESPRNCWIIRYSENFHKECFIMPAKFYCISSSSKLCNVHFSKVQWSCHQIKILLLWMSARQNDRAHRKKLWS